MGLRRDEASPGLAKPGVFPCVKLFRGEGMQTSPDWEVSRPASPQPPAVHHACAPLLASVGMLPDIHRGHDGCQ